MVAQFVNQDQRRIDRAIEALKTARKNLKAAGSSAGQALESVKAALIDARAARQYAGGELTPAEEEKVFQRGFSMALQWRAMRGGAH